MHIDELTAMARRIDEIEDTYPEWSGEAVMLRMGAAGVWMAIKELKTALAEGSRPFKGPRREL